MSAVSSEVAPDRRAVPDDCTALLTVKIGDVSRTSRKHLTLVTFPFLLSEGLDVFRAKVDSCTDKALDNFRGEKHVREDTALYMRPGAHSKQAELVEITHSNFESRVARSYKNYLKRKTDEPFQCEVYVPHADDGYYRTVRMVVNGAIVPVQVNVADILACFAVFQQQPTSDEVLRSHEGSVNGAAGAGADGLHG
ncbi:hypothetical protein PHYSODRAFT_480666 [Phytophthora sojae]|uniref:Uncharacterized protein n=1 Tax=Phytophthora sojae (strain P6497) TaxID=1094619 RepID=G4YT12_PHYSP|nr:hypothetical protein PHYSODRAFT_480666 [Phytophthora sojae]EGZ25938.1 hypothetical protein PHYSODRAFT_480666 [Phytophthora sojae]|eukprot:XP_009521226.1 hypothetical protein PHYSODRAFT_480666 [Phytophthora sojae]